MKLYAVKFYNSIAWRKCREAYFISQYGICEKCSGAGKIVHHTEYITPNNIQDINITLNHDKLELLCQDCHNKEHLGSGDSTRGDVMFSVDGDLIEKGCESSTPDISLINKGIWLK